MTQDRSYLTAPFDNAVLTIIQGIDRDVERGEDALMLGLGLVMLSSTFAPVLPPTVLLPVVVHDDEEIFPQARPLETDRVPDVVVFPPTLSAALTVSAPPKLEPLAPVSSVQAPAAASVPPIFAFPPPNATLVAAVPLPMTTAPRRLVDVAHSRAVRIRARSERMAMLSGLGDHWIRYQLVPE